MNKEKIHNIENEILLFRKINHEQANDMYAYLSDEDVKRYIGWPLMNTITETHDLIDRLLKRENKGAHLYASVILRSNNKVIGNVMLFDFDDEAHHAEVGYLFSKEYWGQGFGTQSLRLLDELAFKEMRLHKLHAKVVAENIGSLKILQKNGYDIEGQLKDHFYIDDKYHDAILLGKINPLDI